MWSHGEWDSTPKSRGRGSTVTILGVEPRGLDVHAYNSTDYRHRSARELSPTLSSVLRQRWPCCTPRFETQACSVFCLVLARKRVRGSTTACNQPSLAISGMRPWGVLGACSVPDGRHAAGGASAGRTDVQVKSDEHSICCSFDLNHRSNRLQGLGFAYTYASKYM